MEIMKTSDSTTVRQQHNAAPVEYAQPVSEMNSRDTSKNEGRALIIAPSFRNYGRMIGRAFELEDWRADVYDYGDPAMSFLQAMRWTSSSRYRLLREADSMSRYNREIQRKICRENPDLCLIINGNLIDKTTIDLVKRIGARLILWCYDSVTQYPRILENSGMYEKVYVFEPTDIPVLGELGVNAKHLSMGYDPSQYYPISDSVKRYDLAFVGSLFSYPDRVKHLKRIVKENRNISIRIWTNTPPCYSPRRILRFSRVISSFARNIEMRTLTHREINEVYNSSRICLNMHHPQCKDGLNPRTFEILGSGSRQLVDYHKQIEELHLTGEEITIYRNSDELQTRIEDLLANPEKTDSVSERWVEKARKSHTYQNRIHTLLKDIYS